MDDYTYNLLKNSEQQGNLQQLEELYRKNKKDGKIALVYAKALIKNKYYKDARLILKSLLNTPYMADAILELGKLESRVDNVNIARKYFKELLYSKNRNISMLELGKLEFSQGNIDEANAHYDVLMNEGTEKDKIYTMLEKGKLEFCRGNKDKAIECFQYILDVGSNKDKNYALLYLIKIFIKEKEYLEAFDYFNLLDEESLSLELKRLKEFLKLYIMKKLNVFFKDDNEVTFSYNNNQLFDYDECVAVEHIIERHKDDFSNDIDVYRLFNDIKSRLVSNYKINNLSINDIYHIPYPNIGNGCDILRVVTLPNSKDILTMFPISSSRIYIDDDYLEDSSYISSKRTKQ